MKHTKKHIIVFFIFMLVMAAFTVNAQAASKINLRKAQVKLSKSSYSYNGKRKKPAVTLVYRGKKLKVKRDYSIIYPGNSKNVGAYTVTVKGRGRYKGTLRKQYRIVPAATMITSVKTQTDSNTWTVSWEKRTKQVDGYQLRYSPERSMKKAVKKTVKGCLKTNAILDSLSGESACYVQVRTYRTNKGRKYYSSWSRAVWGNDSGEMDKPHGKLLFIGESSENIAVGVGDAFSLAVNHKIQEVEITPAGIIIAQEKSLKYSRRFTAQEPGTALITLTDIYGQKVTSKVTVTQNMYLRDYSQVSLTSVRRDEALPVPEVESVYYGRSDLAVICPGTFEDSDPYYGYEMYLSSSEEFDDLQITYENKQWNGLGYADLSFFRLYQGMSYYMKVRSFAIDGNTKVCGEWSSVTQVNIGNFDLQRTSPAVYSYELYFLDPSGTELYSGSMRPIYIKTENPDPSSIDLVSNEKSVLANVQKWSGEQYFDDIHFLKTSDYNQDPKKVDGGYIGYLEFEDSGVYTAELREYGMDGYAAAQTLTWNVLDYTEAASAWADGIIAEHTTPEMTSFEKIESVCLYLNTPGLFKYLTNVSGDAVDLAALPNAPCFKSYRWDSYISPAMLCLFAQRIGGFDEIHNCYWDYPEGSGDWGVWHHFVKLTIGGESNYYTVCPLSSTGDIGEVEYINFSDPSDLYPVN